MIWYSDFFKNFPQFVVIHTVKGFGVVYKAEVFLPRESQGRGSLVGYGLWGHIEPDTTEVTWQQHP